MLSISLFYETSSFGIDPLSRLDAAQQMDNIRSGKVGSNFLQNTDPKVMPPGVSPIGVDDNGPYSWVKIKDDVARGAWEGPFKKLTDYPLNLLNTINTKGDLYQKQYLAGSKIPGPAEDVPKYVKFDDGTRYEYSLQNHDLMRKMYAKKNTIPDWDALDLASLGGTFGIKAAGKAGIELPMKLYQKTMQGRLEKHVDNIVDKMPNLNSLERLSLKQGTTAVQAPVDTFNRRYCNHGFLDCTPPKGIHASSDSSSTPDLPDQEFDDSIDLFW